MIRRQEIQTMVTVVTLSIMLMTYYGIVQMWRNIARRD